jgi:hypothetical protein
MKNGYLPKDQRKKILFLADDMRVTSGVGTMAREIIEGTAHRYNWVQVGAAVSHPEVGKLIDMSEAINNETGLTDASVKIVPYNGYGDSRLIRQLLELEKPDAILHFTDPRYWIWLYQMEHEIRQNIPMFFYAIWDDLPYGTDLPVVIRDVVPDIEPYVVFSDERIDSKNINLLYNIADVTINLSSNEGFGLGTCESMMAGTPIIVNVTGGLQDQCGFKNDEGEYLDAEHDFTYEWGSNHDGRFRDHGEWVFPVFPASRSLQGSPLTPYIFDDRCSWEEAGQKLLEVYNLGRTERKRRGELGRQYGLGPGQFTADRMCELFIEHMENAWENWTPRERFTLVKG